LFCTQRRLCIVIRKFRPDSFQKGNIKNLEGKVIGVHDGIINFTIGQRKGIKVSDKEPLYVLKINSDNNEIIVGPKENLGKKDISLKDLNLLTDKKDLDQKIFVKVRSTGSLLEAKVDLKEDDTAHVHLVKPEDGISPGQACVFYSKDQYGHRVLGGGWIKE
jgi:tRNA-specific 2-thiouridylase